MTGPSNARRVYLDYAATTPMAPQVIEAMAHCCANVPGNPSSLHFAGREARRAIEEARSAISSGLGAEPEEIVFTSGGSEAINLALYGVAWTLGHPGSHIITSAIEHHATLETCEFLQSQGYEVTYLPVDEHGMVQPEELAAALRPATILVSIMHANNEIGTIEPIAELARLAHEHGVLFHTDAVQTAGHWPVDVRDLGVDLLSLSGHKFYGPKGVGALYVRQGVELAPLIRGGAQERRRRAGTQNVPGIVGMATALTLALEQREEEGQRLQSLRDELWRRIQSEVAAVLLNGHPTLRLPNNLSFSLQNVEAEGMLLHLSRDGIAVSMGSACTSESIEPSHVIHAIGLPEEWARGTLRLTTGRFTTMDDIAYAAQAIGRIAAQMRG